MAEKDPIGEQLSLSDIGPSDGSEKRRFPRYTRKLRVTFLYEENEIGADTVDVSKTGALFQSSVVPPLGDELLLVLQDAQDTELKINLKAKVVRWSRSSIGARQFAVEFGDAVSKDVRSMGRFLREVLLVENGLIRVMEDRSTGERIYTFSFEPVLKEGEDRIRAVQNSLFRSMGELDEADAILANFGKAPPPAPSPDSARRTDDDELPSLGVIIPSECPYGPGTTGEYPSGVPEVKKGGLMGKLTSLFSANRPKEAHPPKAAPAPAAHGAHPASSQAPTSASQLAPGITQTQELPAVGVARNTSMPIMARVGTSRFPAHAVRMYSTGMKCETQGVLPPLYSNIIMEIPVAGKKGTGIELVGDVTRVRPAGDLVAGGVFELRFSMRTDCAHVEAYRKLLEKLGAS